MTVTGRIRRLAGIGVATVALIAGVAVGAPGVASAQENPFERGPAPTLQSFSDARGPFAFAQTTGRGTGFAGGTIYYPTATDQGTFGAIVIAPGFVEPGSVNGWFGPLLASRGFVTFVINTNTPADLPPLRANQMLAALDYLTTQSTVKDRVDPNRLAVAGHSMGGGGSLDATKIRPSLKASIPMEPFEIAQNYSQVTTPTLIIGAQNDAIAPAGVHARPFYGQLPPTTDKAYIEIAGGSHFATLSPTEVVSRYTVSWLKRFLDNDTRYDQFLCPVASPGRTLSAVQGKCPLG